MNNKGAALHVLIPRHKGDNGLMQYLHLGVLPDTPLCSRLAVWLPALWQQQGVLALWIGGSIAHGNADRYSDVDLRVAVKPDVLPAWKTPDFAALFGGECVGHQFLSFGEGAFLHHLLLRFGDIYDLLIQSGDIEPPADTILVLGCRDESLAQRLRQTAPPAVVRPDPADNETIRQLLVDFWIGSHKHRKVLHRNLHLLCMTGIQLDRAVLLRLWYVLQTGRDYGQVRSTIHSLTQLTRTVEGDQGARALQIMGAATTSREQIYQAIEQIRDEVSAVGRRLADAMDFPYPDDLEAAVRSGWSEFLQMEMGQTRL
jgi:hypothetical protein